MVKMVERCARTPIQCNKQTFVDDLIFYIVEMDKSSTSVILGSFFFISTIYLKCNKFILAKCCVANFTYNWFKLNQWKSAIEHNRHTMEKTIQN